MLRTGRSTIYFLNSVGRGQHAPAIGAAWVLPAVLINISLSPQEHHSITVTLKPEDICHLKRKLTTYMLMISKMCFLLQMASLCSTKQIRLWS